MTSAKSKRKSSRKKSDYPKRKGISSLIATVLMILVTIATVGIVIQAIMPIIKGNIEIAEKCDTVKLIIEDAYGFTCYDNSTNSIAVAISRGSEDIEIQGFELKFSNSMGESKVIEVRKGEVYSFIDKSEMPELNSETVYTLNLSAINMSGITGIGVAPIIAIGKTSEICKIETAGISVKFCSEQLQFQQITNYTANYTQNQTNNQSQNQTNQTQNQTNQTINLTIAQCGLGDTSGIMAYWRGEGNANDIFGLNNGQNNGAVYSSGKVGQSFNLSSNQYINMPHTPSIANFATRTMTIEAWVRPNTISGDGTILGRDDNWLRLAYSMYLSNGRVLFGVHNGYNSWTIISNETAIGANQWAHVLGVYNGSSIRVYTNGILGAERQISNMDFAYNIRPTLIGAWNSIETGMGTYFNGLIDEVAIYDRALNDSEIQQHYQRSNAGQAYCNATPIDFCMDSSLRSGLSEYLKIDENTGSTTADALGMVNGTITNPLWVPGKINYALNFTGVGINYITLPEPGSQPLPKTISMWIKPSSFELATQTLTNKAYYGNYLALQGNNRVTACLNTEAGPGITCTPMNSSLSLNQWYMITAVYSNPIIVYINGVEDSRIAIPGAPSWNSGNRLVGSSFVGTIDEFSVWSRTLSAQEISSLYNYGFGKTYC